MTEELHVALANFRTTLTKFWKDYVSELDLSKAYGMDPAQGFFADHKAVLNQVLEMRDYARRIDGILHTQPLTSLHKKEN